MGSPLVFMKRMLSQLRTRFIKQPNSFELKSIVKLLRRKFVLPDTDRRLLKSLLLPPMLSASMSVALLEGKSNIGVKNSIPHPSNQHADHLQLSIVEIKRLVVSSRKVLGRLLKWRIQFRIDGERRRAAAEHLLGRWLL